MSITVTTTAITHKWLMKKSKRDLAMIILRNLDRIDIFSEGPDLPLEIEKNAAEVCASICEEQSEEGLASQVRARFKIEKTEGM